MSHVNVSVLEVALKENILVYYELWYILVRTLLLMVYIIMIYIMINDTHQKTTDTV